ncbi:MAG: TraR/DksA family transcriptional regulator [Gemmatimonadaceae bacterium]
MALSAAQLKHFEQRLLQERAALQRELQRYSSAEAADDEQEQSGDLTKVPLHPADLGTDTIDAELDASNATRESAELADIDAALERLYETPEKFGIDERTQKPIPLERLEIIPWARTGMDTRAP